MAAQAGAVTQTDVPIPFILAIGLLILGSLAGELVKRRVAELSQTMLKESSAKRPRTVTYAVQPASIGWMTPWIIEASQSLTITVATLLGFLLLVHDLDPWAAVLY